MHSVTVRFATLLLSIIPAMLLPTIAAAQPADAAARVDWQDLALSAIAGLALFLYGIDLLARALKSAQGGRFQRLLERASSNRFAALGAGTGATVVLDSSSVTIILLIAIVDAGLMPFAHALPMILGANIGTTFSSQLFAWNIDEWSPLLIAGGLAWKALARSDAGRQRAAIVLGAGLVLFGLHLVGDAAAPLADHPQATQWLRRFENPLLGVLAGALATVAIQSSSAMMGIVITLAGGGIITLPAGIAIMLGAEIGTCADTLLATAGRSRAAVKAGVFHLMFNIASVAIGIWLIVPLADFGAATASDTGQQIANAHVLFNVAGALLMLPFVGIAARRLERLVPARDHPGDAAAGA